MLKRLIALCLLTLLFAAALLPASAADTPASVAPGGMCTVGGVTYLTDRYHRTLLAVIDGELVCLSGGTTLTDASGRPVSTVKDGTLSRAAFGEPWGIVPFRDGLLVADRTGNVLRYVDLQNETVTTFAGSGRAGYSDMLGRSAAFQSPTALAADGKGNIYIADSGNHAIRIMDDAGRVRSYVGGKEGNALGTLDETQLSYPTGLCFAGDTLYVADSGNHRIIAIRAGVATLVAGATLSGDAAIEGDYLNGEAALARFNTPMDIAVQGDTVYVADAGNAAIRIIRDGYVTTLTDGSADSTLITPDTLLTDGKALYYGDSFAHTLRPVPAEQLQLRFVDVADAQTEVVRFVVANGLMNGTGVGIFSPDAPITRGTALTILARMDGMDTSVGEAWYSIGVAWGIASGISDGSSPDRALTREELVTMLYRYAGQPDGDAALPDGVTPYAADAYRWAIATGILSAEASPTVVLSRIDAAQLMMRFLLYVM